VTKITALLPFKENSQRIPKKNFKSFNGKPLFHWILNTLISIEKIKKIIINTDAFDLIRDDTILSDDKIDLRERADYICGDEVSMNEIIYDDISYSGDGIYVMTHTTNPLLSAKTILRGLDFFLKMRKSQDIDSLFTVNRYQSRFYNSKLESINHKKNILVPTQNLDPVFEENSNFYIFTKKSFIKNKNRIGNKPIMFETPFLESIDIDTFEDWRIAEIYANANEKP